ncbi:MAG: glycine-rich protein [Planctomycetota bacterium]
MNKLWIKIIAFIFIIAFVVAFNYGGCLGGIENISGSSGSTFSIVTNPTTGVTQTTATLNGTVNPGGVATNVYFEYGRTTTYGNYTSYQYIGAGTTDINVSANITGLSINTTYNFMIKAVKRDGSTYDGPNVSFTTHGRTPVCVTITATNVTFNAATLNGTVNANTLATTAYFNYGLTTSYDSTTISQPIGSGTSNFPVTTDISGLSESTLYNFMVVGTNSAGTTYGNNRTFTTTVSPKPICVTKSATNITTNSARLNGTINPNSLATNAYFSYGLTTSYTVTTTSMAIGSGTANIGVTADISGLSLNTEYSFRIAGISSAGINYGNNRTFTTGNSFGSAPTCMTDDVDNITFTSAILYGTVIPNGLTTTAWFGLGISATPPTYTITTNTQSISSTTSVVVSGTAGSLIPDTFYNFRVVGTNSGGTTNGNSMTFTTLLPIAPTCATNAATNVAYNSATLNATVNPKGGNTTAYFQWGLSASYGNSTTSQDLGSGMSAVAISGTITGLSANNVYYFRVSATNSIGTTLGANRMFGTWFETAFTTGTFSNTVATTGAADVTLKSAFSATGGTITYSGAYSIHTFTSSGTFTPNGAGNVEVLVVAGGGSGGRYTTTNANGGGGGGGVIYNTSFAVTETAYTVTVGAGGASIPNGSAGQGNNGGNSVFSSLTAIGGGGGGATGVGAGLNGGSGGGAASGYAGGASTQTGGYGNAGGNSAVNYCGGGGGGAGSAGVAGNASSPGGNGGSGFACSISGSLKYYGGGGGGGANTSATRAGDGYDGGGRGCGTTDSYSYTAYPVEVNATTRGSGTPNAIANTGGGGGAGSYYASYWSNGSGAGGSGIVIVRYINASSYVTSGTYTSSAITPISVSYWSTLTYTYTAPANTIFTVDVLSSSDNAVLAINVPSGINLSQNYVIFRGITGIKLRANFSGNGSATPTLSDWGVAWTDDTPPAAPLKPVVVTTPATTVTATSAVLNAIVNPNGGITTAYFGYGISATPITYPLSITAVTAIGSGTGNIAVSAAISSLTPDTTYNFRCVATNSAGTTNGSNLSFITIPPPTCTTNAATNIAGTTATLNGTVNPNGYNLTSCYFQYGTTTSYGSIVNVSTFSATGGTITYNGGYTIHTFTSSGTFTPNGVGNVEVLVVAGGGSGGMYTTTNANGGGGGGGVISNTSFAVTGQAYPVTVGAGGAAIPQTTSSRGNNGANSVFSTLTAIGGGGGASTAGYNANNGGSGGGAAYNGYTAGTSTQTGGYGNSGGNGSTSYTGGGGGGAGSAGVAGTTGASPAGNGGSGFACSISGSLKYYGGGGGGGANSSERAGDGFDGGGRGRGQTSYYGYTTYTVEVNATTRGSGTPNAIANTGGGGGAGTYWSSSYFSGSGAGGSGIVIMRYLTPTLPNSGTTPISVTANASSLANSTLYNFRVVAINAGGTTNGGNAQFTTIVDYVPYTITFNPTSTEGQSGTIQSWVAPSSGGNKYQIEVWGAQGGSAGTTYVGGLGARMRGDFTLTAGATYKILVGQQGTLGPASYAGGGGGSFVTDNSNNPLIIAGGGGGGNSGGAFVGLAGQITDNGSSSSRSIAGGTGGNGGGGGQGGGGGGGLSTNGATGTNCNINPGLAFVNGGTGATPTVTSNSGYGGFGGGGSGDGNCCGMGGAGGGYSGGGGGGSTCGQGVGGGGGSYNGGTNQSNSAGARTGAGLVVITRIP